MKSSSPFPSDHNHKSSSICIPIPQVGIRSARTTAPLMGMIFAPFLIGFTANTPRPAIRDSATRSETSELLVVLTRLLVRVRCQSVNPAPQLTGNGTCGRTECGCVQSTSRSTSEHLGRGKIFGAFWPSEAAAAGLKRHSRRPAMEQVAERSAGVSRGPPAARPNIWGVGKHSGRFGRAKLLRLV
jgi:hypothetical protein